MLQTTNIPSPHLVPLPMGEETLARLSSYFRINGVGSANLASPLGRGARQRGEGMGLRNLTRIFNFITSYKKYFS